ncbi:MAG: formate--tetrahydrofolate ligase [Deltaproteobacteria bacterium]|nr:formate--tetrahydrofolate ligase [Deltaproteobacteria bacterium]
MPSDFEISRNIKLKPISEIAGSIGITQGHIIPYGHYFAKIDSALLTQLEGRKDGKLVLITSMSPTPSGEGKTTLAIGLSQSLKLLGKKVAACLRQPSLGPYFGAKGGATGSGYSQVLPAEDIAIQFTGDDYAIVTAHNLISSIIDNHIYHGNKLNIDPERILWNRVSTVNDRSLRKVRISEGKATGERVEEFHISAASELMSILCLSNGLKDLKNRVGKILLSYDKDGGPVTLKDLNINGAVAALLKNAIHPNLVQSLEGVPVFVHGGPFGNISIGCNSLIATRLALKLSDFVLTEAGFATELGAEKFFDIVSRAGGLKPSGAVVVVTLKALRFHGGAKDYLRSDTEAIKKGMENLEKHLENIRKYGIPLICAINRYNDDTLEELNLAQKLIKELGAEAYIADVSGAGGKGGIEAAEAIIKITEKSNDFKYLYDTELAIPEKIEKIAKEIYGADGVDYTDTAKADINDIIRLGCSDLPICIAKTPKSLSDDPALTGRPKGFRITVQRIRPATGAGYLVAICGSILLMPGLPEHPLAEHIDIDDNGRIIGI